MAAICLIEDHQPTASILKRMLTRHGHKVLAADDGQIGFKLALANREQIDIFILDIMLPGMLGSDICRELRQRGVTAPILMLTSIANTVEIVANLDSGADDYLVKPFVLSELRARLNSLLRRRFAQYKSQKLKLADIEIDPQAREVKIAGIEVSLRRKEFDLLCLLANNQNQTLSRSRILENIWGDVPTSENTLDVYIKQLRIRLGAQKHMIQTVHGIGYRLKAA